jgi:hypothetical protein
LLLGGGENPYPDQTNPLRRQTWAAGQWIDNDARCFKLSLLDDQVVVFSFLTAQLLMLSAVTLDADKGIAATDLRSKASPRRWQLFRKGVRCCE